MKSSKIFWGLFFIFVAVYVVVSKFWILPDIGLFSILITVFLIWMLMEGIKKIDFAEILFSIAFLCIVHDDWLGITALTPWTVLGAALFGSIGLDLLFGGIKKKRRMMLFQDNGGYAGESTEQSDGEWIYWKNNFGSAIRYVNSNNFKSAQLENNFGSLNVYFDNAIVQCGSAFVNVDNNFGETILYIPKEWQIQNNLDRSFGTINEVGHSTGSSSTILSLHGSANFGAITIRYI